jgi:hypothetical protein
MNGYVTEVDPYFLKGMQAAQYATQYLRSCQDILRSKQKTVVDALEVFHDEEELLDLEIAKYRYVICLHFFCNMV